MTPRGSIWSGFGLALLAAVVYVGAGAAAVPSSKDLFSKLETYPGDSFAAQRAVERSILLRDRSVTAVSALLLFAAAALTMHGLLGLRDDRAGGDPPV